MFVTAVDERGPWARRFTDLFAIHCDDLGGPDALSEAQKSLVRRAASIEVELERQENALALGQNVDLDAYGRAANTLRRLLETLGIERKTKVVEVTLQEIIAQHAADAGQKPKASKKLARAPEAVDVTDLQAQAETQTGAHAPPAGGPCQSLEAAE